MDKQCCSCKETKSSDLFNKNRSRKDGLQSRCKDCDRTYAKKLYASTDKQRIVEKNRRLRLRNAKYVYDYLSRNTCVDCGENDPIVLDFDHFKDKSKDISRLVTDGSSIARIEEEIAKCEVRCANCHRRKTAKDYQYIRWQLGRPL